MKRSVIWGLSVFSLLQIAQGQTSAINGEIAGTVVDPVGAAIADATVTATNVRTGYRQTTISTPDGLYRLAVLPLGEYSVNVSAKGFANYQRSGIALSAGSIATIDAKLEIQTVTTEVLVSAGAAVVDPGRTDQGTTVSSTAVRDLPLVSRNPFNFILEQPGVSGHSNTEFGVPRLINANGFTDRVNYQLDGNNNVESDRTGIRLLPISQTWVEEVQEVSNGFAPEFGNTVGTVFNSITRSGTNELHSEAAYLFRRTRMSARPELLPANQPTPEVNVDAGFVDAGGPLKKTKLFFFAGYEHVKRDLPMPVTVPPATLAELGLPSTFAGAIPFSQNVSFFLGKVDWQLSSRNRLTLRYNGHRNDSPYNSSVIGGLYLVDRTYDFLDRSNGGAAQLVSVISPNVVNELRFQAPSRSEAQDRFNATGSGPAISIPGVANFGNSLDVGFRFEETTPEVNENLSYSRRSHAFKFGGSVRAIRDTEVQATAALYTFPSVSAYLAAVDGVNPRAYVSFVQTIGNPSMRYNSLFTGAYAQDTWKPQSNITITYGARYDVYKPPTANEDSPFPYSRQFRTDKDNVAPRLGIALGLGNFVVRASGGIFFDPFQTDMYRLALLNNGTPSFFAFAATPQLPFAPAFPTAPPAIPQGVNLGIQSINTVDPGFSTLYSVNANVSVSREITRDTALTISYLFTRGDHIPIVQNINLVPSGLQLADGRPIFGSARVYPDFGNILVAESVGQSEYNALNITLTKRLSHGLQVFATYTWSHAIDDAPEQNVIDSPNFMLSDPTNRRRDRGNSLTDRPNVFNGNLVYAPEWNGSIRAVRWLVNGNRFAILAVLQSGDVFNMGSNLILNGDPSTPTAFQRPLFIGRNTIRGPWISEFNVRYTRLFALTERVRLEFVAESTNVFNHTNVVGRSSTATVTTAGSIIAEPSLSSTNALDQRLLQLGIKLAF
jgi:hypothetical protein